MLNGEPPSERASIRGAAIIRRAALFHDGSRAHERPVKLLHEAVRYAWNEPPVITGGVLITDRDGP